MVQAEREQKLADARLMRDIVVTQPRRDIIAFAYKVVAAAAACLAVLTGV